MLLLDDLSGCVLLKPILNPPEIPHSTYSLNAVSGWL